MVDNDVTVRYLLKDDLTGGLRRMQGQAAATKRELAGVGSQGALLTFFDRLDGKVGNLDRQLSSLDRRLVGVSRSMQHDLVFGLGAVTAGMTAAAGAADYFGLRAVNSFQHTMAAFAVLTGSLQGGKQLYNQLLQLNLRSPFDQQPLASAAQTLLGFRIPQQNLLPILTSISNVAAVQQDPNEALTRMALAIGQINQSGFVRAQDLNQLVQAGFPAYQLIPGGHAGLLAGGGGTIPASHFLNQLLTPGAGPLGRYSTAAQAMNQTLSGQWSNLTTMVRQEAIKAFSPLGDELVKEMPHLTRVLSHEVDVLAPGLARIGGDLIHGAEALLPVLTPLVNALVSGIDELGRGGAPFLRELEKQEPDIINALGEFFTTLADAGPDVADFFGAAVQLLPPFVHGLDDLIQLATPFLDLVDGILQIGPARTIVGDLLVGLLAYRTLAPAIKAVQGMAGALFGLAEAETAASVAGGRGVAGGIGLAGTRTYRGGRLVTPRGRMPRGGRALGILGGLSIAIPGLSDVDHRGIGSDLSTIGGLALAGSTFGPFGALAGAGLGGAYDLGVHVAGWMGGGSSAWKPSAAYNARMDAYENDPRLQRLMGQGHVTINMETGAISVHGAKDDVALAQTIQKEIGHWIAEHRDRR